MLDIMFIESPLETKMVDFLVYIKYLIKIFPDEIANTLTKLSFKYNNILLI